MPRPRLPIARPPCPFAHQGDLWPDLHPDGRKPHKFIEPLPRRHPTDTNPRAGGRRCESCEHILDRHEGPQTARGHVFSIHEAARLLVEVGKGTSYRWSSRTTRRDANRLSQTLFGKLIQSAHGQLAQDYLGTFAPVVLDAFAPPAEWPDAVVLDSKPIPFTLTTRQADGAARSRASRPHTTCSVSTATLRDADPGGRGKSSSRAGRPAWNGRRSCVRCPAFRHGWVCDDDKGIKWAVGQAWPNAVIHTCEGHLKRLLLDRLAADGEDSNGELGRQIPAPSQIPRSGRPSSRTPTVAISATRRRGSRARRP